MRLSTSTCIYFNRPDGSKADINDSIRRCAKAGYQVMDMNFHDLSVFDTPFKGDQWESYLRGVRETAMECGVEFSQGHAHFYNFCQPDNLNTAFLDELVRRSILGAKELGVKWLVIHAASDFGSPYFLRDSKRKTMEYLLPRVELAAKSGVGIALENLWEENIAPLRRYCVTVEELLDLVDSFQCEQVGCCWDVEHAAFSGLDQCQALQALGKRLKATHISDYTSVQNDHILP
ncbi:MAG: sugar phosphate isomerase/epimerase, partial [Clostridia bacterium]